MTLEDIKTATDEDKTLKGVRAAIKLNEWHYDVVKPFKNIKDELTVTSNGLILRGSRIVIPESLQQRAIDLAHETHPGLSKTKALLREKVWFPNIDKMVKCTVDRCIPCQAVGKQTTPEPLAMTDMPTGPWEIVHLDFYGPLPSGDYLLVGIDRYSRFPEVEIVKSTKASVVIPKLDKIFATHGIPNTVKTDPPFNGEEYSRYLAALGITPKFSTPLWPQSNAEAERFMQPLGKTLRTAKAENRPWQQELNRFLLQYRTTPHSTTGVPPAELLFNRTVEGKLPILQKRNILNRHREARQNEASKKEYHKRYADSRRNTKKSAIKVGDCALVRQQRRDKLTPYFNEVPYTVTHRHHSRITARNKNGHTVTRNVSHFKLIRNNSGETDDDAVEKYYNDNIFTRARISCMLLGKSSIFLYGQETIFYGKVSHFYGRRKKRTTEKIEFPRKNTSFYRKFVRRTTYILRNEHFYRKCMSLTGHRTKLRTADYLRKKYKKNQIPKVIVICKSSI